MYLQIKKAECDKNKIKTIISLFGYTFKLSLFFIEKDGFALV